VLATKQIENVDGIKSVMNNLNVVGCSAPLGPPLARLQSVKYVFSD
jgi:hypothetical protein